MRTFDSLSVTLKEQTEKYKLTVDITSQWGPSNIEKNHLTMFIITLYLACVVDTGEAPEESNIFRNIRKTSKLFL